MFVRIFLFAVLIFVPVASDVSAASAQSRNAETVRVVASIKPIHALAASVMAGVGVPELLMEGARSPHGYALTPSQARKLARADVIFWVGPALERFLERHLGDANARSVVLMDAPGLDLLRYSDEDAGHGGHGHGGHGKHDDHAKHDKHDDHDKHAKHDDHDKHAKHDDHDKHDKHDDRGAVDPHIWLDPENAKHMVERMADALALVAPEAADQFHANAAATITRLEALRRTVDADLTPHRETRALVSHAAYGYFERRFQLTPSLALTINPEIPPGAERVAALRRMVKQGNVSCMLAEPQFEPKLLRVLAEDVNVRVGRIDALGLSLPAGPDLYFDLIRDLAASVRDCHGQN